MKHNGKHLDVCHSNGKKTKANEEGFHYRNCNHVLWGMGHSDNKLTHLEDGNLKKYTILEEKATKMIETKSQRLILHLDKSAINRN